ncbi:hypothetical protein DXM29_05735 [Agrobacterium tumefaciens]|uniref:hypothetical protein n=1 Tax=Agrobacterium tumefaciens TaxID=358 RepID=UPI00122FC1C4|nr:hypothetical protein DXM29_05735 [Agrobacterium tumefaciens]
MFGDIELSAIQRADTIRFRDWWVQKNTAEKLKAYSANRSITDIAGMLTVIDDALQTEFHNPWEKGRLRVSTIEGREVILALLGALSVQRAAKMITRVTRPKREDEALAVRENPRYQTLPPSLPRQLVLQSSCVLEMSSTVASHN